MCGGFVWYNFLEVSAVFSKLLHILRKYEAVLIYLFFGIITTLVNYAVYYPLYNFLGLSALLSNIIAWCVAVLVAFFTNKPFVFKSHDWSAKTVVPELTKFVGSRIASGALETAIIFVTVDLLLWNGNVMKLITSVLVVVLNYVASKLLVFKK